jgi:hypothetical protein
MRDRGIVAAKAPVRSGRGVERAALVAALAEDKPDEKNRGKHGEREKAANHDETGSTTAAVP